MSDAKVKAIEVVALDTNEVISTIDISPPREDVERTLMGLLRNMDTDRYYAREVPEGIVGG